jgi:hypothetical protein
MHISQETKNNEGGNCNGFGARRHGSRIRTELSSGKQSDALYWLLALLFGAACGYMHVRVQDSNLSVLMVTGFTMFLAYHRPERVWRWAVVMGLSMPAAGVVAMLTREHPSHGMIAGTFAGLAFSIVAAVGGRVLRRARTILFPEKEADMPEIRPQS